MVQAKTSVPKAILIAMNKRHIQCVLVILIASFILAFPAYLIRYTRLSGIAPSRTALSLENCDQDDQLHDYQHESGSPLSTAFSFGLLPMTNDREEISHFYIPASSLERRTSVLRR